MNVYSLRSYKKALLEKVAENKSKGVAKSTYQGVAAHCRIQKTYLSKVLNHEGHLTEDQLYLACEFLEFDPEEREFLTCLYRFETSVLPARRLELKREIARHQAKHLRTESYTSVKPARDLQNRQSYYSDPLYSVIHMLLTVEKFKRNPSLIGEELGLSKEKVQAVLEQLEKMKIIKFERTLYHVIDDDLHLPAESSLQHAYRTMMRVSALNRMGALKSESFYSFSAVFSSDESVKEKIRSNFLVFLKSCQELVKTGSEDEVYQMNFDLFPWTRSTSG